MAGDAPRETYTHGHSDEILQALGTRTAAVDASFFVPHLSAGMAVLDCGCGPGSITVDLAEIVAPGQVIGVDIAGDQLAGARSLAAKRGIANVRFERGNIYELQFPDRSFDAVFANHVIEHLSDPVRALKEVRRVLKLGGIVGICNDDWSSFLFEPATPLRTKGFDLFLRVAEHNGGNLCRGRHNRRYLREAGFVRTEGYGRVECDGTLEQTCQMGSLAPVQFRDPAFVATVLNQGWADQATLDAIVADFLIWGEDPDAYSAVQTPSAIGWVGDAGE